MRLSTDAYFAASETGEAVTVIADLAARAEGLIALTGGLEGPIDAALADGNAELARARLEALQSDLRRPALCRAAAPRPAAGEGGRAALLNLAYDLDLPLVATNEPYFASAEDFEAHDALICIAEGSYVAVDDRRRLSPEHYFKTGAQMRALFADLPEALDNTIEIARRCAYRPLQRQPILPPFLTGGEASSALAETEAAELRRQSEAGLKERIAQHGVAPGHDAAGLCRAARLRARCHHRHELSGLLPDRRRLHQMGQGRRHPRRARPRLGRGLARRLRAHHHRSRSDPLRAAVRALPQSRARVDARFRHRFLPGPARRGDRLCARALRRAPRRPDHHLRQAAGARRAARRRPRAADALRPGRSAVQARADEPGQSRHAAAGHRRRAEAAGGARRRADRGQAARYRPAARRASTATPRPMPPAWSSPTGR